MIYPYKHYNEPVYWTVPDDGAKVKCAECKEPKKWAEVILTQIPKDNSRRVLCLDCVDPEWLAIAMNMGEFKE